MSASVSEMQIEVPLAEVLSTRAGLTRALAAQGFGVKEIDRLLAERVVVECIACGIRLPAAELEAIAWGEAASEADHKLARIRQGYCARSGCACRFYRFRATGMFELDWPALFRQARELARSADEAPEAEEPEERAGRRFRLNRRGWVLLAVLGVLLVAASLRWREHIPGLRPAEPKYQLDPSSLTP